MKRSMPRQKLPSALHALPHVSLSPVPPLENYPKHLLLVPKLQISCSDSIEGIPALQQMWMTVISTAISRSSSGGQGGYAFYINYPTFLFTRCGGRGSNFFFFSRVILLNVHQPGGRCSYGQVWRAPCLFM